MLTLPIKRKWFDMICTGKKREEYREPTDYWKERLFRARGMCVGGFLGFGLGMMLFALAMRPADEAGRKSDAERIRRLEGELQATSAKYREMANMMAYWRSRCIAYEKMLVERSRKAGAEK